MKRCNKRLMVLVLFLILEVVGICASLFPRIWSTEEEVFQRMNTDDGYAMPITIKDGSIVKIRLFWAALPLLGENSGEMFALSQSGDRLRRRLYLKPPLLVTNVLIKAAKEWYPDEKRFFEYLQRIRF